jgi:glyoxylate reductase
MREKPENVSVLITREFPDIGIEMLKELGFHVTICPVRPPITQPELIRRSQNANALFCSSEDKIDSHFLQACSHLQIISQFAAGFDNIDINAATRLGIPIGNTPNAMSDATADVAFGLMIAVSRKMMHMYKNILEGKWGHFVPKANLGQELKGKTLGIFGLGRIGLEMAARCKGAYKMDILYCNRHPNRSAEKLVGAKLVSFDDLLTYSDVLSVHSILSDQTRGIFNRVAFAKMKSTSIFINTSRGALHNEDDLVEALKTGQIWGAGLDVTNPEPMAPDHPLLYMPNVCVTPHIGSSTIQARNRMAIMAATNIIEFYKSGKIPNLVNSGVL